MVTAIDGMGYIPTIRKSWEEPWSEPLAFWFAMAIVSILTILSLGEINWLTAPYLAVLATLNISILSICAFRRKSIPKPIVQGSQPRRFIMFLKTAGLVYRAQDGGARHK